MAVVSITSPIMHKPRILFLRFYPLPDSFLSILLFIYRPLGAGACARSTSYLRSHLGLFALDVNAEPSAPAAGDYGRAPNVPQGRRGARSRRHRPALEQKLTQAEERVALGYDRITHQREIVLVLHRALPDLQRMKLSPPEPCLWHTIAARRRIMLGPVLGA